jgi:hypothetical protein
MTSGASAFPGYQRAGRRQKVKVGSGCSTPFGISEVVVFSILPFAFQGVASIRNPKSKIKNSKSSGWVTDPAQQLVLESTVRPRGRPTKQS